MRTLTCTFSWLPVFLAAYATLSSAAAQDDRGAVTFVQPDTGRSSQLYQKSFALVIGIDAYTNGWRPLKKAVEDAREVAKGLKAQGFDVTLRTSEDLEEASGKPIVFTKSRIEEIFNEFIITTAPEVDARLLIWFAGHGVSHKVGPVEIGYLVGADAPNPAGLTGEAERRARNQMLQKSLLLESLEPLIRQSQAKHLMMVFDSCFAGNIFVDQRGDAPSPPRSIELNATHPTRFVITSGAAGQTVPDDGKFREVFLAALSGTTAADRDRDNYLTATELTQFLMKELVDNLQRSAKPQFGPLRMLGWPRGDFIFKMPQADAPRAGSAPGIGPGGSAGGVVDLHGRVWKFVDDEKNAGLVERYVARFQDSPHLVEARAAAALLRNPAGVSPAPKSRTVYFVSNRLGDDVRSLGKDAPPPGRGQELLFGTGEMSAARELRTVIATIPLGRPQVSKVGLATRGDFQAALRTVSAPPEAPALVFVHGGNVSFTDALSRAATLADALKIEGPVVVFSWPSSASVTAYIRDRETALASTGAFREFLETAVPALAGRKVHIIADTLGATITMNALRDSAAPPWRLGEVVLTLPDLPAQSFDAACRALKPFADGVTTYVSGTDRANYTQRAIQRDNTIASGVRPDGDKAPYIDACSDRIDVSAATSGKDTGNILDSPLVLGDMATLLKQGQRPPDARSAQLRRVQHASGTYWRF